MARADWLDPDAPLAELEERARSLETFTDAIADGVVEAGEVERQLEQLRAALKDADAALDDAQHAKVTRVLVELTAYNMLRFLHELHEERKAQVRELKL